MPKFSFQSRSSAVRNTYKLRACVAGWEQMSEKQVLSVLLTDETETLNRLVKKAERSLKINKKTGDTILLPPKTRLTDRQLIALYLLGRYFSSRLELTQTDTLSIEDLCKLSNLESNSVSARISDL